MEEFREISIPDNRVDETITLILSDVHRRLNKFLPSDEAESACEDLEDKVREVVLGYSYTEVAREANTGS